MAPWSLNHAASLLGQTFGLSLSLLSDVYLHFPLLDKVSQIWAERERQGIDSEPVSHYRNQLGKKSYGAGA